MGRTVTVTGRGRASAPYDEATLRLAATARAANPSDATARATYAMAAMREAVLSAGAEPEKLSTTHVTLNPVHDPWPKVVAYEATLGLAVSLADLARVGSLLVAAIDAGGDGARVDGIVFSHSDPASLEKAARDAAYADALAKAEQYAGLAGQVLGEVRHIAEAAPSGHVRLSKGPMMAMADSGGAPPVDGGEGSVDAVLTVAWALGPSA
ncbi:MAG TPA: SIMPL domain-containing protein [Candidatus Nanopelagicales bacterium]|nr:SIMPL domain-containing protein [Candidatus Nanopelagicales bacterium]